MDDLDRSIGRRTARNAHVPKLLAAETKRLELIDSLVVLRKKNGLSQTDVALEMGVGQSVVAEIESGQIDVRYTTLDRYVSAVSREKARLMIGRVSRRRPDVTAGSPKRTRDQPWRSTPG